MKLATIVSFCTHDYRFFKRCIEAVSSFSSQVIVPICDHFFNGEIENLALLEKIYEEHPAIEFIEFAFDPTSLYGTLKTMEPQSGEWGSQWHNSSRLIGYYFLKEEIDTLLFCDVDEIIDEKKFGAWLKEFDDASYNALRFSTYWYFREPIFQATTYPNGPLLVKRNCLTPDLILNEDERMGLFLRIKGKKEQLVPGLEGIPMVHHYSWVRTKEELHQKAQRWSHHGERDWKNHIDEEYAQGFQGQDFVRKYQYQKVTPFFDPLLVEVPQLPSISLQQHRQNIKKYPHVKLTCQKEIFRKEIRACL